MVTHNMASYLAFIVLLFNLACIREQVLFTEDDQGWVSLGNARWTFTNDELTGTIKNGDGFLITKKSYADFELSLEFFPDSTINSGVFISCSGNEVSPINCYEMNIWDLHPKQEYRTGAIVLEATPLARINTINKWNTYKIRLHKNYLQVWVNDTLTADINEPERSEGYIALQASGNGQVKFRNIRLQPLN